MKIIIVGGTGTLGKAVVNELSPRHELVIVGQQKGELQVDITKPKSIEKMYQSVKKFDAVIVTAGKVHFGPLEDLSDAEFNIGLQDKLMGQINIVLVGMKYINEGGSFTLTSGILNVDPIRMGTPAAMVNGGIEAFVKSAAIEVPKHIRINAVSPNVLTESMPFYGEYFRGFQSVPAAHVALAFSKSVEGAQTGQVYTVW
jgi:NAD(P)-dependent dehydrogenase (short-subunit alcohol dehydrogenase family)